MGSRKSEIALFKAFTNSLSYLCKADDALFSAKRPRVPLIHRLAIYLEEELGHTGYVDLMLNVKLKEGSSTPDILVHDRNGYDYTLAIYARDSYLSARDKEEAIAFHNEKKCLTLAFTFLQDKDYFLVYRFGKNYTDYMHVSKLDFSESILKRTDNKETEQDSQLYLGIKPRKKAKS